MKIPMLLVHDEQTFKEEHREACSFLCAANLRYECFKLYCQTYKSDWDKKRFKELIETPACREGWFRKLIKEEN